MRYFSREAVVFPLSRRASAQRLAMACGLLAAFGVWLYLDRGAAAWPVAGLLALAVAGWFAWTSLPAFRAPRLIVDETGLTMPGLFAARVPWEAILHVSLYTTRRGEWLSLVVDSPEDYGYDESRNGKPTVVAGGHSIALDVARLSGGRPAVLAALKSHAPALIAGAL